MTRKDLLGTNKLDFLRITNKPELTEIGVIVESPDKPQKTDKPIKPGKDDKTKKADSEPELTEKLTILVNADLAGKLYGIAYWDRKYLKDVVADLLEEAVRKRPDAQPAPPEWIEALKSRGKRKKT